ncbi:DUF2075 domain-containing protein [soil metagenome]
MPVDLPRESSRAYYEASVLDFLRTSADEVIGAITTAAHAVEELQKHAWLQQIKILKSALNVFPEARIYFEFQIPRVGRRADCVLVHHGVIFILEFKVGGTEYLKADMAQAEGYAIDLKNFHEGSRAAPIVPILVATKAPDEQDSLVAGRDQVFQTLRANAGNLAQIIYAADEIDAEFLDARAWGASRYAPTPTIIEAATHLYANHDVREITQSGASAENLSLTSNAVLAIVESSRRSRRKSICFVTGVPGAGKTLVGLNIATSPGTEVTGDETLAVYLSGNGPLVSVLREALARDEALRLGIPKSHARRKTERFIQNIHHFRDDALKSEAAPIEHVVVFDEAQRAWNRTETSKFMQQKKGQPDFDFSEPEFLIGVMDRHDDWCVIVALVGGGQEINSGEAGLTGWYDALQRSFPTWDIYYSESLSQSEYDGAGDDFMSLATSDRVVISEPGLHLSTSMRSFRARRLSHMIHHVIANAPATAQLEAVKLRDEYPMRITRSLTEAKAWIRAQSRAHESRGLVASSGGMRLRPHGVYVKNEFDPAVWFLNPQEDVRASYFLETVATEFDIQGLELDWVLVAWDADLRHNGDQFEHFKFTGTRWNRRNSLEEKQFLENAYRVLLTRARQGLVIFIPEGHEDDVTRRPAFYDKTFEYLLECGFQSL